MSDQLRCDGCKRVIGKNGHIQVEQTWFGSGDPPVSLSSLRLHFHRAECAEKYTFEDWRVGQ